jgi:hypothetical protein
MELLDLSHDVLRQIMIHYIDNSKVNQLKLKFIGSHLLNEIVFDSLLFQVPPLIDACIIFDNDLSFVQFDNIDCKYVDENGSTSLMYAIQNYKVDFAKRMLNYDCNLNQINRYDTDIFEIVCSHGMNDIAHIILNNGYVLTQNNYMSLLWSCVHRMNDIALKILDVRYNSDQVYKFKKLISQFAGRNEMLDVIEKMKSLYE